MACGDEGIDFDSDFDFDPDKPLDPYSKFQTSGGRRPVCALRATPRQAAEHPDLSEKKLVSERLAVSYNHNLLFSFKI